jgi:hypothetical protein
MTDHSMFLREDARAMGAVTALDVRVTERWTATRTRVAPCVSIAPDGTTTLFSASRTPRDVLGNSTKLRPAPLRAPALSKREKIDALLMSLPTIHEEEGL